MIPRAVLDALVKRKIPSPRLESNTRTAIILKNLNIFVFIIYTMYMLFNKHLTTTKTFDKGQYFDNYHCKVQT